MHLQPSNDRPSHSLRKLKAAWPLGTPAQVRVNLDAQQLEALSQLQHTYGQLIGRPVSRSILLLRSLELLAHRVVEASGQPNGGAIEALEALRLARPDSKNKENNAP